MNQPLRIDRWKNYGIKITTYWILKKWLWKSGRKGRGNKTRKDPSKSEHYSSGKINFSSEWVENTQKKNTPTDNGTEKREEKVQVTPSQKEKKEEKKSEVKQQTIRKKEYAENDVRNEYIQYAYNLWWWDLVAVMECENSTWNQFRQSEVVKNGIREDSRGFCMIHRQWHSKIVDDPRFWNDWKWQIEQCNTLYKGGTKFYAPERWIAKAGMRCKEYVKDRFIFN